MRKIFFHLVAYNVFYSLLRPVVHRFFPLRDLLAMSCKPNTTGQADISRNLIFSEISCQPAYKSWKMKAFSMTEFATGSQEMPV